MRSSDGYAFVEPLAEAVVRKSVHRGTIQVNVWVERQRSLDEHNINLEVLPAIAGSSNRCGRGGSAPAAAVGGAAGAAGRRRRGIAASGSTPRPSGR